MAMTRLNNLYWGYNSSGGVPVFLTKFRDALQDLRDAQEPISSGPKHQNVIYAVFHMYAEAIG